MTVKELVSFTDKSVRSVRNWIKKSGIDSEGCAKTAQGATDYSIDEVESILNAGSMSKDAINILMQNARGQNQITPVQNNFDMKIFADMIAVSMATALKPLYDRMDNLENNPKQLLLPSEPQEEPRAYLNRLVREYSTINNVTFRVAWNVLYTEMLYKCRTNVKVKARNEGIKPIDYLENANLILTACSIMKGMLR